MVLRAIGVPSFIKESYNLFTITQFTIYYLEFHCQRLELRFSNCYYIRYQ